MSSSSVKSLNMNYSSDDNSQHPHPQSSSASQQQQQQNLPPAYEFQRSERPAASREVGRGMAGGGGGSVATNSVVTEEDSIDFSSYSEGTRGSQQQQQQQQQQQLSQQQHQQQQQQQLGGSATAVAMPMLDENERYSDAAYGGVGASGAGIANESYQHQHQHQHQQEAYHPYGRDATATVHVMHRSLLRLLSTPEEFQNALTQARENPGLSTWDTEFGNDDDDDDNDFDDPTFETNGGGGNLPSLEGEGGRRRGTSSTGNPGGDGANKTGDKKQDSAAQKQHQQLPLAYRVFAPDAEVVLPQALTASQLFGIERVTGIELEAAAGIPALSQLFLRWLALMPEGDHTNVIDPPGLTVMRIAGGRYRVTGAHRVVWRWMNKFSPATAAFQSPDTYADDTHNASEGDASPLSPGSAGNGTEHKGRNSSSGSSGGGGVEKDTDFDFGDLVTMTIVDVFETDEDGKLLSYCPTFDNRAVHKTNETVERLKRGRREIVERFEGAARSPAGARVNKAAGELGKMSLKAAMSVRDIVKTKLEGELHKGRGGGGDKNKSADGNSSPTRRRPKWGGGGEGEGPSTGDTNVGGGDGGNASTRGGGTLMVPGMEREPSRDEASFVSKSPKRRGENYFSDDSTAN